jgi:hypothetical protein
VFDECVSDIRSDYERLGHTLGWRFLSVSRRVLDSPVKIALVTINPAGDVIPEDHPWESCESGISYIDECWGDSLPGKSKLQVQVQELFAMLQQVAAPDLSWQQLMARSLISHFVPFRSPRIAALPRLEESLECGRKLWKRLLPVASPQLVICLGREVQSELRALIPKALTVRLENIESYPTGWGNYSADIDRFVGDGNIVRLLYLPHLSTWTLFTSSKCAQHMPRIVREACSDL